MFGTLALVSALTLCPGKLAAQSPNPTSAGGSTKLQSSEASAQGTEESDTPQLVDFGKDIAPILETHCIRCHYPGHEEGGISLATVEDLRDQTIIVPGAPDDSYLIELVSATDSEPPEMPKEGERLDPHSIRLLRQWIQQGAEWPASVQVAVRSKASSSWWSLQPVEPTTVPMSNSAPQGLKGWKSNPIDRLILAKLSANDLQPNPPADRRTLIRRATYDLTGLPPEPKDVADFVSDTSEDAYPRLIDRLLASEAYGEHWGRHWLDVVRFGESTGYERNLIIDDAWPFRDYIIASLNADKSFKELIREHVAGDLLAEDKSTTIGPAFLVNGPYDNVGNQDAIQAAQIRADTIDEMIRATSEAFLGLTIGCARCHDHKFDPIRQTDYYRLYATFAGVKHGSSTWATEAQVRQREEQLAPLTAEQRKLDAESKAIEASIAERAKALTAEAEKTWTRGKVDRRGTEESFAPTDAKYVRIVCERRDDNVKASSGFRIDEFEVWTDTDPSINVALAENGAKASGASRSIEDFPGAYGPQLAIDGKLGARFISASPTLQIEFSDVARIHRVHFSSARSEPKPEQAKFTFVADYRIEVSVDGEEWTEVAHGRDRAPLNQQHRDVRLEQLASTDADREQLKKLNRSLQKVKQELASVPALPTAWIGSRDPNAARGPFHVFLGGSPQRKGEEVRPASLSFLDAVMDSYSLETLDSEGERRLALANWLVDDRNPLTARVLANRIWHYHFGQGLVSTPNDFGYMGQPPSHPELLDWLADQLVQHQWKLKEIHRLIMLSDVYQQSSRFRERASSIDSEARLLWRFPPRRLAAEEIRDSVLMAAGELRQGTSGPGFRLYRYLQDNVATYVPLDDHGEDTFRRSVYHQNARASRVDLLTDFDQPDCAFSNARRAETTTPLQALTALNHQFTLKMATSFASRLEAAHDDLDERVKLAYSVCYSREPDGAELEDARLLVNAHGLRALCRVLFNTSEFIYVR